MNGVIDWKITKGNKNNEKRGTKRGLEPPRLATRQTQSNSTPPFTSKMELSLNIWDSIGFAKFSFNFGIEGLYLTAKKHGQVCT